MIDALNRTIAMDVSASAVTFPAGIAQDAVVLPVQSEYRITRSDLPDYTGPYEFTPGSEEQVIQTKGKAVYRNITVSAIPENYGLITWNGSVLTVS